jgi:4-hydroxy-4-methyl-2-oxoglutarate aldolase
VTSWRSARPLLSPRLVTPIAPLDPSVPEALRSATTADLADLVGPLYTLDPAIRPLYAPMPTMVGRALTVKAVPGDNRAIIAALGFVEPGDVLVVDWRGFTGACGSGAKVLSLPKDLGLAGVVIDGAWRDVDEVADLGVPIFGRGESVLSPIKSHLGEINVAVCCGGVVVDAGDVVFGDSSGLAVIPRRHADQVVQALHRSQVVPDTVEAMHERARARRVEYDAAFAAAGGLSHPGADPR